jgi:competence protein ComEC
MRVPAAIAAVPLIAGAAAGVLLAEASPERFVLASAAGAVLALLAGFGFFTDRFDWAVSASVVLGCALAGFGMGASSARGLYAPSLERWFDERAGADAPPVALEGVLREDAARTDFGASLVVDVRTVGRPDTPHAVAGGVRVSVSGAVPAAAIASWRAGRVLRMPVLLRRPASFRDPGVPDEARALARRGIALLGSVKSAALVEILRRGDPLDELSSAARAWVRSVIARHVGRLDPTSYAIALSILIGDRTGLSDADERRLQDAGTYHVIAISGGNIAILTGILVFLGRLCRVPYRTAAVVTIVLLIFYGKLAGGSPSVSRAVAVAVVLLLAVCLDHRGAPLNTTAVAGVLGVAAVPVTVVDAGFLLSFGATAGIILGVPALVVGFRRQPFRLVMTMLAATVCAELAIAPVAASFFSRVTAAGMVVNFAAIPLMTVVQAGSMLLLAVSPISPSGADLVARVVHLSARGLLESSRFVEWMPWLARDVPAPAWWLCGFYYAVCVAVLLKRTRPRLALLTAAVGCLAIGPPFAASGVVPLPAEGRLRVVVLDVGQGDATLVVLPDRSAVMVDAGGLAGTSFDIGARVLVPAMHALQITRLHAFVLTHADPDHAGGAAEVLRRFPVANVWEGVPVPPNPVLKALVTQASVGGTVWRTLRPGDTERAGGAEIRVLHPPPPDWERQRVRNDDSVVLEVRYRDVSVLLPGDIGSDVERALIPALDLAPVVVLKAAHHGSATSSSEAFIDATKPAAVIFSAGTNNRFGHPAKAVVERFARRGVEMFNTADDGAVFVETDGRKVEVKGWSGRRRLELRR